MRFEPKCAWFGCTAAGTTPIYCTPENRVYDFCDDHLDDALKRNAEPEPGDLEDSES